MAKPSNGSGRKPPYTRMIFAIATVLTLIGVYTLLLYQGRTLLKDLRERITVVVELRPSLEENQRVVFEQWLGQQAFAKTNSITFIDKATGAAKLRERYGEDFMDFNLENPLYELFTFNVTEAFATSKKLDEVKTAVDSRDESLATYVEKDLVESLSQRVSIIAWVGIALGVLLVLGVVFLIVNTTRLALLSKAQLIKNMELVGASWGFISKPFLITGAKLGAFSGVIAAGMTFFVSKGLSTWIPFLWQPLSNLHFAILATMLIVIGLLLNFASTYYVVRKTLNLRVDDLAALR